MQPLQALDTEACPHEMSGKAMMAASGPREESPHHSTDAHRLQCICTPYQPTITTKQSRALPPPMFPADQQKSAGGQEQGDGDGDGDDEDGSRMDLLADLREEQRARRKGGGRSVSALMGGRRKKEKDALVIKGQGGWVHEAPSAACCWWW